ncbi:AAA family ATPase [Cellulomonas bogoriensis]|uniref:ATPase n=1 Tax=Cellulomonas bogoriensis 69B4 = DSM 16987 TaxID=1386082 RepID=A0A0A0BZN1_9CELL|nr:hypothetical protein [Cellulomonas bogoriensis]KGM13147.1 ATPase [Cellulomonas bogoriensis 69B4 = DSM 16987]
MDRPTDLYDRTYEWDDLTSLASREGPGLALGILSGRRRHGKSYLLRRVAAAAGGLYHQARELETPLALAAFADDVAEHLGYPAGSLRFDDWEVALRTALGMPRGGGASSRRAPGASFLVLDEFPYLLERSPSIPSILQLLYDEAADREDGVGAVVVCGSALSVMRDLLSGQRPLRGRAQLDMTLHAFDYRQSREFWGVVSPHVAFQVHAVLGGTPGYKNLVRSAPPEDPSAVPRWLMEEVMSPASALFGEQAYLLREDPRSLDRALYTSVLTAVAQGSRTQSMIGARVGRDHNRLRHPLSALVETGFLRREEDALTRRRPLFEVADPIIRFTQAVIEPHRALLEERQLGEAWNAAAAAFSSQVLGPQFEHMARVWASRYAGERFGEPLGDAAPAVINDADARAQHEVDVVAGPRGADLTDSAAPVVLLGEAKATNRRRTVADLHRLEHVRDLLVSRGRDAGGARLTVFSTAGFDGALVAVARARADVHLVDLAELYDA